MEIKNLDSITYERQTGAHSWEIWRTFWDFNPPLSLKIGDKWISNVKFPAEPWYKKLWNRFRYRGAKPVKDFYSLSISRKRN